MRGEGGAKENENTKHERKMRTGVWRNRGSKQAEKKIRKCLHFKCKIWEDRRKEGNIQWKIKWGYVSVSPGIFINHPNMTKETKVLGNIKAKENDIITSVLRLLLLVTKWLIFYNSRTWYNFFLNPRPFGVFWVYINFDSSSGISGSQY